MIKSSPWTAKTVMATLFCVLALALAQSELEGQTLSPPPEPRVKPFIGKTYHNDPNNRHIEEQLYLKAQSAVAAKQAATNQVQVAQAQSDLGKVVEVELVFEERVTQKQIDDFLAAGGEITHLYRAVSYGWN